jgi:formylglycine-generating enzyme required for sulfatase activity
MKSRWSRLLAALGMSLAFGTLSHAASPALDAQLAAIKKATAAVAAKAPAGAVTDAPHIWRVNDVGLTFTDCPEGCPAMVVIPAGAYTMGAAPTGPEAEGPQHRVAIRYALGVGKYPVTFDQWDACVAAGGCNGYKPGDAGWGRGNRPVVNVSIPDAQAYAAWLSAKTGHAYRLLSEAEYEYANRAGSTTLHWWGDDVGKGRADCASCGSMWDLAQTAPVGSFAPNPFGLYDTSGNIWEWIQDCWNDDFKAAPLDGSVWKTGNCTRIPMRGGSWAVTPKYVSSTSRYGRTVGDRDASLGFRVARVL